MIRRRDGLLISIVRRFSSAREGSIAVIFALLLIPVFALVGAAIDYSRAAKARTQLQDAVDAATLAAAQKIGGTYAERQQAAYGALQANLATSALESLTVTVTDVNNGAGNGVAVDASGVLPTSLMNVVGVSKMDVGAKAEALAGSAGAAEIALVLDNTGSMVNDMPALKTAASTFVNAIFSGAGAANVKMSVVPYVAAVNVGSDFPVASLELGGVSQWQGQTYRGAWLAYLDGCSLNPSPPVVVVPDPGPPPPPPPPIGDPSGKDKTAGLEKAPGWTSTAQKAREVAQTLFGLSRAVADVTANSVDPIQYYAFTPSPPDYPAGNPTAQIPVGYKLYGCTLQYDGPVSNLELFNRIPGASWKGCVEARGAPFDVTDDPPNSLDPMSRFVPYFAPDERDSPAGYRNNYLADIHASWTTVGPPGWSSWDYLHTMFKYDKVNLPSLVETPPTTRGPNANCPDPLLRLTNDKAKIIAKINSLNYWAGGGTISSEGLMWGWRTLAPKAPFADGADYPAPVGAGTVKKHIVLMTDGLNSLVDNRPGGNLDVISDYTAYSFLSGGRLGGYPATFPAAESFLNTQMLAACANAKAKGISIYTILFRETDQTTKDLLKSCASAPSQALLATDAASLSAAFASIGAQISSVRLSK